MILRTISGDKRVASLDGVAAMEREAGGGRLSGGATVSANALAGMPAANACIRIASWAVMKRPMRVWRGEGIDRRQVATTWQARFFAGTPNDWESWSDVFEQTEASMTSRNNAFWLKLKDAMTGRVAQVEVKHPDLVQARWNTELARAEYRVRRDELTNSWTDWLTSEYVLHFRAGYIHPGAVMAPSPVQLFKDAISAAVSKRRYETNFYNDGLLQGVAVTFPKEVEPEQARRYRDLLREEHGGVSNSSTVRVFGGGAKVDTIGLSLADAQFVEGMQFSAREMAQIFGVPASLIDANDKDTRPLSPEHEEDRWHRHLLEPRLMRIQERLRSDADFFGANARDYPAFAYSTVKGDVTAESARLVAEVQAGILLPDEARAEKGLVPLPDGVGQIAQITPVGGAPNPDQQQASRSFHFSLEERAEREPMVIRNEITVPEPPQQVVEHHIHVEPTPIENNVTVDVEPTPVNVEAPAVTVENTVHAADVPVHVAVEPTPVHVHAGGTKKVEFTRDMSGQIAGAEVTND
jgi:HK97 family phage portal protein